MPESAPLANLMMHVGSARRPRSYWQSVGVARATSTASPAFGANRYTDVYLGIRMRLTPSGSSAPLLFRFWKLILKGAAEANYQTSSAAGDAFSMPRKRRQMNTIVSCIETPNASSPMAREDYALRQEKSTGQL